MTKAKVFWFGGSQAIRLPKEFRLESSEVRMRRHGEALILEPVTGDWAWLSDVIGPVDRDFEEATTHRSESQERSELDGVLK